MKEQISLAISFYQRTDKVDKNGAAPVFLRITVNGDRAEIATNKRFDVDRWRLGHPAGTKADAKELQKDLESMKAAVNKVWRDMVDRNEIITAATVKERFTGRNKNSRTVVEIFTLHNAQLKALVGIEYSPTTALRYETTLDHVKKYMKAKYHKNDLSLWELNYEFVAGWEYYLKTEHKCNHNTAMKYIKNFRKVINLAIKNEWLDKDPFAKFECKIVPVERNFLTGEELTTIEEKVLTMQRMDQIRDIFVFCCYTGLAYVDVLKLTAKHIEKGIDGKLWIKLNRTKTETKSQIPLLPKALAILDKYKDTPKLIAGTLLPVISNQKMNAYLKELADLCEINKTLTSHIARHTFATTVTLTNGVPIETVSAMLGHKSMRTTQIYSKVVEKKVGEDMAALREKMVKAEKKMKAQNK
jgi:site-specific recombinase XerD